MIKIGTRRRALSSIVTAGIMLSAVAVLGSAVISWSNGNLKVFEIALTNTAVNSTNKINENIVLENIAFCSNCGTANSKNVINVTLTNTGTVSSKITQIQIDNNIITSYYYSKSSPYSSSSCPPQVGTPTCLPAIILPKQSYTIAATLPSPKTWTSGKVDTITVTTSRGSTFTTQAAPS